VLAIVGGVQFLREMSQLGTACVSVRRDGCEDLECEKKPCERKGG
jgi:hypothetical protein